MDGKARFLALALTALLLAAGTAYATALATPAPAAAEEELEVIEETEGSPEEEAAEEAEAGSCEEAHEERAEGEITRDEERAICEVEREEERRGQAGGVHSGQCPLRSARAHAASRHDTLKVTLGYTAYEPFEASIQLLPHLGSVKRHLNRAGILRFTKQLGSRHPHKLVLKLRPVGSAGCPSPRLVLLPG
jgi:hypothetical protein